MPAFIEVEFGGNMICLNTNVITKITKTNTGCCIYLDPEKGLNHQFINVKDSYESVKKKLME